jgi:hypothetical protein
LIQFKTNMTFTVDYTYPIGSFGLKATQIVAEQTGIVFAPFNHRDKFNGNQTTHFSGSRDQIEKAKALLDKYVMRRQRWLAGEKSRGSQTPTPKMSVQFSSPPSVWTPVSQGVSFASKVDNWIPTEDEIQGDMDEILDAIIQLPGITHEMAGEMEAEELFLDLYFEETEPEIIPVCWFPVQKVVSYASKVDNWTPTEEEIQGDMDEILDAIIQLPGITHEMAGEMEAEELFLDLYFEASEQRVR